MPTLSPIHDFDFLEGTWRSRQRRLKRRLAGCDEWETFSATARMQRLPGGVANVDTMEAEAWRPGWVGLSLRVFDVATGRWSIYWHTNERGSLDAASGRLAPPVVGRFDGDEGLFLGDDVFEGRPIRVRYRWLRLGAGRARWEQAFSADGGALWETNWVMDFEREPGASAAPAERPAADIACELVELRRYTLHPGARDTLIELFDREFVESQEAVGMAVMGQFREPAAPDRFVWLRGFPGMAARRESLAAFYGGPVWQRHRDAANATMIDSDDVHLLRPAWPGAGLAMAGRRRAAGPVRMALPGGVHIAVFPLHEPASDDLLHACRERLAAGLQRAGAEVLGWYVSEEAPNDFPRLPVHTGRPVLVGVVRVDDPAADGDVWRGVQAGLQRWLARAPEIHRLVPTARSALHG